MSEASTDLSALLESGGVDVEIYNRISELALVSFDARDRLAELVAQYRARVEQGRGEALKLALGLLVLGRCQEALDWLGKTPDSKFRRYYAGKAALGLGRHQEALAEFSRAAAKGWDRFDAEMQSAAIQVQCGNLAAAEKLVEKHAGAGQDRAGWYYLRGLLHEYRDDWATAIQEYEKALALDPDHAPAVFRCAWLYDIHGEDEQAIELYGRLAKQPGAYVNALINLAVIDEDIGKYDEALECLQRVLKAYPNHTRARLFLKDVQSCQEMVVEEAGDQQADASSRLLETPISEFDLSVRARNCLQKMNVNILGDLVKLTEVELLSYKNFGETSLYEIRALLAKRGMRLGQQPDEAAPEAWDQATGPARVVVPPGREPVLSKPVSELELSVRARRCLQRVNVLTLGDLIQLSEADLLAARNFGVTSLNEVKARLAENGLQLAPKRMS